MTEKIEVPGELVKGLKWLSKKTAKPIEELLREAITDYLAFLEKEDMKNILTKQVVPTK